MQQPPYPPQQPQGYPQPFPPQSTPYPYPPQQPYQQPPFYQQPGPPPSNWRPPVGPPPKRQGGTVIVLITVAAILIIAGGALAAANASNQQAAQNTSSTPTIAATSAPVTPTPATLQEQILQSAKQDLFGEQITSTVKDGKAGVAEYIDTTQLLNEQSIVATIKHDCFSLQKDLWQAKMKGLQNVELRISGPTVDPSGKDGTSIIGRCALSKATAAKFNWANLYDEKAWPAYDDTYLLPSLLS